MLDGHVDELGKVSVPSLLGETPSVGQDEAGVVAHLPNSPTPEFGE